MGVVTAPSRAYYQACEGRWAGRLDLRITNWKRFRAQPMGRVDRLSLVSVVAASAIVGRFRLETSVACDGDEVIHTTRISKWGIPLLRTRERLVLDPNGRDVTMHVVVRQLPFPWRPVELPPSPATIDEDGRTARYRFRWFGAEMRQRGERAEGDAVVTLTQETDFSEGVQVLRRQA